MAITTLLYGLVGLRESELHPTKSLIPEVYSYSPAARQISEEFDVDMGQSLGGISIMI